MEKFMLVFLFVEGAASFMSWIPYYLVLGKYVSIVK